MLELWKNHRKKWTHIKFARQVGNKTNSIWHSGAVNQWGHAGFFVRIPWDANPAWRLKVSVWNPHDKKIYLDDFYIEHFR